MDPSKVRLAANPINWSNDDFRDLGGETSLETCLGEMREAGYIGTELGHKYPRNANKLKDILDQFGLQLAAGWYSSYLLDVEIMDEGDRFARNCEFLKKMGTDVAMICECSRRVYHNPEKNLDYRTEESSLTTYDWEKLVAGIEVLQGVANRFDLKLVFHPHMGTVVQNQIEIEQLLKDCSQLQLAVDTGHLYFAGVSPQYIFDNYIDRIGHVHLKNVRYEVVEEARKNNWSFAQAVRAGVFTVPGDAGLDFEPLLRLLESKNYEGWLVVEAEQDPYISNPLEYARIAREYIKKVVGI